MTGDTGAAPGTGPRSDGPLLSVRGLRKEFHGSRRRFGSARPGVVAVDGVDFDLLPATTLGLVGESGSGKSTTARLVLRLLEPTAGTVVFDGRDVATLDRREIRRMRADMQPVFQDVSGALNPRLTVEQLVVEPMRFHTDDDRATRRARVPGLLDRVGLSAELAQRYPYELSGGQRQRVGIARALSVEPRLVVLDEPVSALDVSTQSQVVNLLTDLQKELRVAYLLIAHDLHVVHHVSDWIAVMYLGVIVEMGPAEQVYQQPRHPYTQALLSAIPPSPTAAVPERERIVLAGDIPSPSNVPPGCRFHTRCPYAFEPCATSTPESRRFPGGGQVACHLHDKGPSLDGESVDLLLRPTPAAAGSL